MSYSMTYLMTYSPVMSMVATLDATILAYAAMLVPFRPANRAHLCYTPPPMETRTVFDLRLDDLVQLRKPHPCGSLIWRVVRLGADIGLRCQGCGHKVLLPRSAVQKRLQRVVPSDDALEDAPAAQVETEDATPMAPDSATVAARPPAAKPAR